MPFTISHAAVVLPFSRILNRWRLLSAAVIGAMVPDFGLFFPWPVYRFETHSTVGLFSFCLPVGLASYWIFQGLIKTPMLEVLPDGAYARWRRFASPADLGSVRQWILAACGVFAGAVSHLVWDAFTHFGARGARMIPWLDDPVVDIGNHHVLGARLLQDGTSLIGLVVVFGLMCYGLRRGHEPPAPSRPLRPAERRAWVAAYVLAALALSGVWYAWWRTGELVPHNWTPRAVTMVVEGIAVSSLRGIAFGLLCVSLALDWRLRALRLSSAHRPH
jgi:hypothetical protein